MIPIRVRCVIQTEWVCHALLWALLAPSISFSAAPVYSFKPAGKDGGGGQSAIAVDPFVPGRAISGADISGFHVTYNHGRRWTPINIPAEGASLAQPLFSERKHFKVAAVRFSKITPGRVYACVGDGGASGGFLMSDNAGATWMARSSAPQFSGGNASAPLPTNGHPRSVGNLIALDASQSNEIIYVGTYKQGVMRSTNSGGNWATITIPGFTKAAAKDHPYIRGIAISDTDPQTVYAGVYDLDNDGVNESVFKITNARTATTAELIQAPFPRAEELVVINGVLYVAANNAGVYKYDGTTWTSLYKDADSIFYSIDGYWDNATSQAVIYAGTSDHARSVAGSSYLHYSMIRTKDSGANWTCLTADESKIKLNRPMGDASGDIWWHSVTRKDLGALMGGNTYVACQTVIDPTDRKRLYVAGRAGTWRSDDVLTPNNPDWYPAMRYMNVTINRGVAVDPNRPNRAYCLDVDWTFLYSTDNLDHVMMKEPSSGGGQEYTVVVDSTSNPADPSPVYLGRGTGLYYHPNPAGSGSWSDNLLSGKGNVMGVGVKKTAAGTVVLAAATGTGIWRKVGAGTAGSFGAAPVFSGNNVMKNLSGATEKVVFSWGGGDSQMVYFTDRDNGVFRSLDGGLNWLKINGPGTAWNGSGNLRKYCGYVAVDPTNDANCFVTNTGGVWFTSNANATGQPSFSKVTIPGMGNASPSSVVYDDEGNVYIYVLAKGASPAKIFFKATGDTVWANIAKDDIFKSQAALAFQMVVGPGPDHRIYLSCYGTGLTVGSKPSAESRALRGMESYNY